MWKVYMTGISIILIISLIASLTLGMLAVEKDAPWFCLLAIVYMLGNIVGISYLPPAETFQNKPTIQEKGINKP